MYSYTRNFQGLKQFVKGLNRYSKNLSLKISSHTLITALFNNKVEILYSLCCTVSFPEYIQLIEEWHPYILLSCDV